MKAIILAAGMGTRICEHIDGRPKPMVDIGSGVFLLDYTINLLKSRNIHEIGVCIGYNADFVKKHLKNKDVTFFYNPFYSVTNSIASIWFAKDFIDENDDLLILSGDLYMEPGILDIALASKLNPVLLADSSRIVDADYRFSFKNGILTKYGKDLSIEETDGENLGLAVLRGKNCSIYKKHLLEMINQQKFNVWWENVLYDLVPKMNIYIEDTQGLFWAEVDQVKDYKRILEHRKKHEKN